MLVRPSRGSAVLALAAIILPMWALAPAAAAPAECQALTDALLANAKTPFHSTTNITYEYTAPVAEAQRKMKMPQAQESEAIFTGTNLFLKLPTGKWVDAHATAEGMREQVGPAVAKWSGCERLADETLDGAPTAVYVAHSSDDRHVTTMKFWVATDRGLVVRTDADVGVMEAPGQVVAQHHMSTRTTFGDQQAPAVE